MNTCKYTQHTHAHRNQLPSIEGLVHMHPHEYTVGPSGVKVTGFFKYFEQNVGRHSHRRKNEK